MPYPPRTTVFSEWNGLHANPRRGPKLFQSASYPVVGYPATPRNFTTPGVPETGLTCPESKLFIRLFAVSTIGVSVSHRNPRLTVRFGLMVQLSCAKPPR